MTTKDPQSLRNTLNAAAESVHLANYQTMPHEGAPGLENPGDVYDAIGNLKALAGRLPQLLNQLTEWLEAEYAAGRVAHDTNPSALQAVSLTDDWLSGAAESAEQMEDFLGHAHSAAAHLKSAR
jgi:hypothetical protein